MNAIPYCMCSQSKVESILEDDTTFRPMSCIKTGAMRIDKHGLRVYPNVDVFRCDFCMTVMALEIK